IGLAGLGFAWPGLEWGSGGIWLRLTLAMTGPVRLQIHNSLRIAALGTTERLLVGRDDDGNLAVLDAAELNCDRTGRQVELDALACALARCCAGERGRMQVVPAVKDVDPAFRRDRQLVNARLRWRGNREMARERLRRLRRALGRLRQSGRRERCEFERHRDIVGERSGV